MSGVLTNRGAINPLVRLLARFAVASFGIGVVALTAGYRVGPEHFWPIALTQYVPYPAFLLPGIAALGLSLMLGWSWRLGAFLGVLLVVASLTGLELNRGESGARRIRVMTYNIKDYITLDRAHGLAEVAAEVGRHHPDIVVMQDARRLAEHPGAVQSILGNRQAYLFGQYVVASRFPIRDCGRREMPFRGEAHTYVSCTVTAEGMEFEIVTTHLLTPRSGLSAIRHNPVLGLREWRQNVSDRLTQAETMARALRSQPRPVIVAGDFNAPSTSLVVRALLDEGLRDAFSVAGVGYGHTWGHSLRFRFSFLRIDHILAGPEFRVADCFVGGALGSEHRPVIADLYLTRED